MTTKPVVTDEQLGRYARRESDLFRRVREGSVPFEATMDGLQRLIQPQASDAAHPAWSILDHVLQLAQSQEDCLHALFWLSDVRGVLPSRDDERCYFRLCQGVVNKLEQRKLLTAFGQGVGCRGLRESVLERLTDQELLVKALLLTFFTDWEDPHRDYLTSLILRKLSDETVRRHWNLLPRATETQVLGALQDWRYLCGVLIEPVEEEVNHRGALDPWSWDIWKQAVCLWLYDEERGHGDVADEFMIQVVRDRQKGADLESALICIKDPEALRELIVGMEEGSTLIELARAHLRDFGVED